MRNIRAVFDDDFYRLGAVILSDKFAALENALLKRFEDIGCPIPPERFPDNKEYTKWLRKVTNNRKGNLPRAELEKIIKAFNLDSANKHYYVGLFWKVYYGKPFNEDFAGIKAPISIRWGGTANSNEAIITIFPWTKKEDFAALWPHLRREITKNGNHIGKEKFRTSFERDFKLYVLYKKRKNERKNGIKTPNSDGLFSKSLMIDIFDDPEAKVIFRRFGSISAISEMKKIVNYFNKLLAGISID